MSAIDQTVPAHLLSDFTAHAASVCAVDLIRDEADLTDADCALTEHADFAYRVQTTAYMRESRKYDKTTPAALRRFAFGFAARSGASFCGGSAAAVDIIGPPNRRSTMMHFHHTRNHHSFRVETRQYFSNHVSKTQIVKPA